MILIKTFIITIMIEKEVHLKERLSFGALCPRWANWQE